MKRLVQLALLILPLSGCAHFGLAGNEAEVRQNLWSQAHEALAGGDYSGAAANFERLARTYPTTLEGRESLFYLGAIGLDPRNPAWDSAPAEEWFSRYLGLVGEDGEPRLYRYPEARTLEEIARQLNLPAASRVIGLQPEERVVVQEDRVVAPATESRQLASEIERLQAELADRDARIREQQAELERIRRTLTGSGGTP
ncbi:MAG: hypothetical protein WD737_00645 [Gemmatimonadota bacterium]